jgi:hypothetical protein
MKNESVFVIYFPEKEMWYRKNRGTGLTKTPLTAHHYQTLNIARSALKWVNARMMKENGPLEIQEYKMVYVPTVCDTCEQKTDGTCPSRYHDNQPEQTLVECSDFRRLK